ncbi:hypothetical protein [Lentzea terrae]|uniref:hypothetical protein n=1 Tax=Lentzea terrae TaxID=2200761 RepID=UPI000DD4E954|nr:hypothetical protein [Lentzea terrae]
MSSHVWQLLAEPHTVSSQRTGPANEAGHRDLTHHRPCPADAAGTGAAGTGARQTLADSMRVLAIGHATTTAAAIEEAFDAAELHVLTATAPFVLTLDGQELRVIPSPSSVDLSLAILAGLRAELRAESQWADR